MDSISRAQALAFRYLRHGLAERAAPDRLLDVAAMGLQNSPPTSAALSFGARLRDLRPEDLDRALYEDKSLIQLWSARAAPYIVPTGDIAVFTTGMLPDDEASCLYLMRGATAHLQRFAMTATEAVEATDAALEDVLGGGHELTKDELGVRLAAALAPMLAPSLRSGWEEPDGLRSNTYGQSIARFALSVVSLRGRLCFARARGTSASRFTLVRDWLGDGRWPEMSSEVARAELVRRFLRYLGPGSQTGLTDWAGVSPASARASWKLVADELTPVICEGKLLSLLAVDVETMRQAPPPRGVRLLPPHDPYLAPPDRATLAPDRAIQRRVWRITGNPGVVLVDGEVAGVWHPRKDGDKLTLRVEAFRALDGSTRDQISRETEVVGRLRQAEKVAVAY